jgi:hypothetical protein
MSNLLVIVLAKTVLMAVLAVRTAPGRAYVAMLLARGYAIGTLFGLAFFALFYLLVPAIGYHADVTFAFVAVNATLSYGATAVTVALLPVGLARRDPHAPLARERTYYTLVTGASLVAFAATGNGFVRAFCIGVTLMSLAEVAALLSGRAGPVSRMLHRDLLPLALVLAASAGLGAFYEAVNLVFPVWDWVTLDGLPRGARAGLMIAVGYIVLIHPAFVVTRLLIPAPGQRDS